MGSGKVTGSVTANSGKFNFYLQWTSTPNTDGNYSDVTVKTYWSPKSGYSYWDFDTSGTRNASITIDGTKKAITKRFYTGDDWSNGNPYLVQTYTKRVYHNDDGTKSITISARANGHASDGTTNYGPSSSTASSGDCVVKSTTITLDTIPRVSKISATSANIGEKTTITIARSSSAFTHTVTYAGGNLNGTIIENSDLTSVDWTIPTDFYNEIPNDKSINITLQCSTYNGEELLGSTVTLLNATVTNSKPILNPGVVDMDSATSALTGDYNILIKYFSDAACSVGATAQNGATITETTITCGGDTRSANIASFVNVETGTFVFTATDSRGFTTTQTVEKTLIPYTKLTCDIKLVSVSADGTIKFKLSGNFFAGSFGAVSNTISVGYQIREEGNTQFQPTKMIDYIAEDGTYEVIVTASDLDYKKTYSIMGVVTDKLTTRYSAAITASCVPMFDWGRNDFSFNVPISIEGFPLVDQVIEVGTEDMGTNGTWYWRKWRSGRAECHGCRNYGNMSIANAWGTLYMSNPFTQSLPTGLFVEAPDYIDVQIYKADNYSGFIIGSTDSAPTASATGSFRVARGTAQTATQMHLCFNVIGRWK